MLKVLESRILWGVLLILGGVLFLLQNLHIIEIGGLFWAILFGVGAVFFLSVFIANRQNWWALIPAIVLFSICLLIALETLSPELSEIWGGSLILAGIGLSFVVVFLVNRQMWWAIIPAGVLISLAIMLGVGNLLPGTDTSGLFLIGLGLTFALVALVPTPQGHMWWAWIPAGALVLIGLILTATAGKMFLYIWPVALILGGVVLIYFTLRSRKS
jgi:hypothetical protein